MKVSERGAYDPETITRCGSGPAVRPGTLSRRSKELAPTKSSKALCLLRLAARGERDPLRLGRRAMMDVLVAGQSFLRRERLPPPGAHTAGGVQCHHP